MSFVYAINDIDFVIMSDTKIRLDKDSIKFWNSQEKWECVREFGLIKSVIVLPNIVICFAGNNINYAAELIRKVKSGEYDLEQIISMAYHIHSNTKIDDVEFLIASCGAKKELISIKNHQVIRNCRRAWVGSSIAYKKMKCFEEKILNTYSNPNANCEKNELDEVDENSEYKTLKNIYMMEEAFKGVVASNIDADVGGIPVRIKIPCAENHFEYMGGTFFDTGNRPQIVEPGEAINFYRGAEMGSCCYNIYQSSDKVCCYIYENKTGIVYTDEVSYAQDLDGMMFPRLYYMEEEDFMKIAEGYGAYPCLRLQVC